MKRVPEDIDAMKNLLQYGFLGTSLKIVQSIDTEAVQPFVSPQEQFGADVDDEDEGQELNEANKLCDVLSSLKLERFSNVHINFAVRRLENCIFCQL